jgi:hypothetical protein
VLSLSITHKADITSSSATSKPCRPPTPRPIALVSRSWTRCGTVAGDSYMCVGATERCYTILCLLL